MLLARPLRALVARHLIAADSALRAVMLGLIPVLYALGVLGPGSYVALLALSSLLHAWGLSGQYTLASEHLPPGSRTVGNALVSSFGMAAYVIGPALAGCGARPAGPGPPDRPRAGLLRRRRPAVRALFGHVRHFVPACEPARVALPSPGGPGALTVLASPLGTALGGPLTTWLGPQRTLLISAAATLVSGVAAAVILAVSRRRGPAPRASG